ncbi:hypothetical protein FNT36_00275 [Hymenobacter setariae]|uniref:DUF4177 domain-containing protein n=1 Tax=Hymenobacter setariae TaxID=2594794 RepID=A0A558C1B4_9BACT|nr:hypothetical protein [Hymenobacter setariae]TVT42573.1 hypothetical protein FNT36_00275 [Hymenobacter setariae]
MFKYFTFSLLLLLSTPGYTTPAVAKATAPATATEQYCIVNAVGQADGKAAIKLVVGNRYISGQLMEAAQVNSCSYEVDALNYLATCGWQVISIVPYQFEQGPGTRYILRRVAQ